MTETKESQTVVLLQKINYYMEQIEQHLAYLRTEITGQTERLDQITSNLSQLVSMSRQGLENQSRITRSPVAVVNRTIAPGNSPEHFAEELREKS